MRKIPLRGKLSAEYPFALVDDDDYELIAARKWYAIKPNPSKNVYAVSNSPQGALYMHRLVMAKELAASTLKRPVVDHLSSDGIDNRKFNLKVRTSSQNSARQRMKSNNVSGYRGVSYCKRTRKYVAKICFERVQQFIGYFPTPEEASAAWQETAQELFGDAMPELHHISSVQ